MSRDADPNDRSLDYLNGSTTLFVGNLSKDVTEDELYQLLKVSGRIRELKIGMCKSPQEHPGYCFVEYENQKDAEDAFKRFKGYVYEGVSLRVDWDIPFDRSKHQKVTHQEEKKNEE